MGSWICLIMNCSCDGPVMLLMIDRWGWWNLKRGTLPLKICKFRPSTQWELQQISAWISILPVRVMRMWHSPWHIPVNHTSEVHSHSLKHSSSYRSLMIFSHYLTWPAICCTSIPHTIFNHQIIVQQYSWQVVVSSAGAVSTHVGCSTLHSLPIQLQVKL
jgi:hypothetical protein